MFHGGTPALVHSISTYQANVINEDTFVALDVHVDTHVSKFYGVFDGHGGRDCSHFMSHQLASNLLELSSRPLNFETEEDERNYIKEAIRSCFSSMDNKFLDRPQVKSTTGSCALVACFYKKWVFVANIGDSRAILCTSADDEWCAKPLSVDQDCQNEKECMLVRQRTADKNPIRRSPLSGGPLRVAGSLMVTRAMGDAYLKRKEKSFLPYSRYVPYITCTPVIKTRRLDPESDKFVLLASDGLYNWMSNQEVVDVVRAYVDRTGNVSGAAQQLIDYVLREKIAVALNMSYEQLRRINPGNRRLYHDDITVVIVAIDRPDAATSLATANGCHVDESPDGLLTEDDRNWDDEAMDSTQQAARGNVPLTGEEEEYGNGNVALNESAIVDDVEESDSDAEEHPPSTTASLSDLVRRCSSAPTEPVQDSPPLPVPVLIAAKSPLLKGRPGQPRHALVKRTSSTTIARHPSAGISPASSGSGGIGTPCGNDVSPTSDESSSSSSGIFGLMTFETRNDEVSATSTGAKGSCASGLTAGSSTSDAPSLPNVSIDATCKGAIRSPGKEDAARSPSIKDTVSSTSDVDMVAGDAVAPCASSDATASPSRENDACRSTSVPSGARETQNEESTTPDARTRLKNSGSAAAVDDCHAAPDASPETAMGRSRRRGSGSSTATQPSTALGMTLRRMSLPSSAADLSLDADQWRGTAVDPDHWVGAVSLFCAPSVPAKPRGRASSQEPPTPRSNAPPKPRGRTSKQPSRPRDNSSAVKSPPKPRGRSTSVDRPLPKGSASKQSSRPKDSSASKVPPKPRGRSAAVDPPKPRGRPPSGQGSQRTHKSAATARERGRPVRKRGADAVSSPAKRRGTSAPSRPALQKPASTPRRKGSVQPRAKSARKRPAPAKGSQPTAKRPRRK